MFYYREGFEIRKLSNLKSEVYGPSLKVKLKVNFFVLFVKLQYLTFKMTLTKGPYGYDLNFVSFCFFKFPWFWNILFLSWAIFCHLKLLRDQCVYMSCFQCICDEQFDGGRGGGLERLGMLSENPFLRRHFDNGCKVYLINNTKAPRKVS